MEETISYWCHMCSQTVNPITESEIKCPFCQSGFIEEMSRGGSTINVQDHPETDRAMSLWAPILLGMMSTPRRQRQIRFRTSEDNENDQARRQGGEIDLDREFESLLRRRRRSSANVLQLLQGIHASEYQSEQSPSHPALTSLGDYFIGPGLDLLIQNLAENDPNRQGTPPARKEVVDALPTVKIMEPLLQCSVCLDEFEKGVEVKEMPCKHKFHVSCIVPWLEIHSSCPVCRFELTSVNGDDGDESKVELERPVRTRTLVESVESVERGREEDGRSGNGRRFSFPWPFSGLFSSSSSSSSSSGSSG